MSGIRSFQDINKIMKIMKNILLTGGSGLLGKELVKIDSSIESPIHEKFDVSHEWHMKYYLDWFNPDIIIHAAAILDTNLLEKRPDKVIETNIIGTANLAKICWGRNIRLVYLSTDYIYKGDKGDYKEDSEILPFNFYAWSKLGGECAVRGVQNHLIIRTTFGPSEFPYKQAFKDGWRSKDYVDIIAPMIYEAAISDLTGVLNIGTDRKSMYSYAKERNKDVEPILIKDSGFDAPWDTSLNLDKWKNYKNGK